VQVWLCHVSLQNKASMMTSSHKDQKLFKK
jgi:hypothetical protein